MPDNVTTPAVNQQPTDQNPTPASATPESWDAWLQAQPDNVKSLYQTHTAGLQNTVKATRQERDDLARQIKDLLPKAEKGSELEKSLTEFSQKLDAAEKRAQFVEEAVKPEIGCRNPKAAYVLAAAENLFTRSGAPDWNAIKAAAPELFGTPSTPGNAGNGTDKPAPKAGMNEYIRHMAGRS
jgi:hypothetical protein